MGTRGPIPKRAGERLGHRGRADRPDVVREYGRVKPPAADRKWHPIARRWYRSLAESGQSRFYEPSDWAAAHYVAEVMTRHLSDPERTSAELFGRLWTAMHDLLTTEAARRRVRVEVDRIDDPGAGDDVEGVTALDAYR